MALPFHSQPSPKGEEEGTPLQALLRKPFSPRGEDSPLSALLGAPARVLDPGKPREKTGEDIIGVTDPNGQFRTRREFLLWVLEKLLPEVKGISLEEIEAYIFSRLVKGLCPICARENCQWYQAYIREPHFKD